MIDHGSLPIRPLLPGRRRGDSLRAGLAAGSLLAALGVALVTVWAVRPLVAAEVSPGAPATCPVDSRGSARGGGGVDCIAITSGSAAANGQQDALGLALTALAAGTLAGAVALATWDVLRRRFERRLAATPVRAFWICDACRSFNPIDRKHCYHCAAPRDEGATVVSGAEELPWTHRFGHPWDGVDRSIDSRSGPDRH